ncbi:MAG: hypothetical protein KKA73_17505 [Chloroflexi bacterium]|nr:hypothetical protein [Chloroflexota bacterium]MBU1749484.1 hypothetical protein [Chloroflexota bacterium]
MRQAIRLAVPGMVMVAIIVAACTTSAPADTPTPTSTPPPTSTPAPTGTSTPAPTQTPVLTPMIVREAVNICVVQPDGKPGKGSYIQIQDANYKQIIPSDGTTGIMVTADDGCRAVRLPRGSYHVGAQKVMGWSKYATGTADFEVTPGSTAQVQVNLIEIK